MIFIGIDPGKSGGIALLRDDGTVVLAVPMPDTERGIYTLFSDLDYASGPNDSGPARAVLERVYSSPQMGVVSAFTFGKGYGGLTMALTACGIPFDEVTPQRWQKALGCLTGGDKNVSKRRAQALFPSVKKITHAIADSLLIAEYCRRVNCGMFPSTVLSTPKRTTPATSDGVTPTERTDGGPSTLAVLAQAPSVRRRRFGSSR